MNLRGQISLRPTEAKPEAFEVRTGPRPTPYARVGVWGIAATITGAYSSATSYLHFNIAANTAEWKNIAPDYTTGFPSDTVILDGSAPGAPYEYWILR